MNLTEFLAMGGYGAYVWSCFGLVIAVLIWNIVAAGRLHADARRQTLLRIAAAQEHS